MTDQRAFTRREVHFTSGTDRCHAWLYRPDIPEQGGRQPPVIVMAHGLGAIKILRLDAFAERFATAGYACLVFDYRHFGDSEGQPRELLSIRRQRDDWRAAVTYARTLPGVDRHRIVAWGTSFAGGHAITTAADMPDIAAAIAQCPFTDGLASTGRIPPRALAALLVAVARDQLAHLRHRAPVRVKVAARPGEVGLMSADDIVEDTLALLAACGLTEQDYPNDVPARVALTIPFDRPGGRTRDVSCPILFCVCEHDSVAPPKATLRHAARAPRGEVRTYDAGHFDIYTGDLFEHVIGDQLDFLTRHVPIEMH
ncbi:MAG TPA: alpha/beta fold hydrolase [Actinomycetospora sp.]|jgi:hypothetical protein|uniref:alpha/beta hydrolase n=1 Tax=Actinomycetospora sp. TaxID=1872135 RepID=UPI002F408823